MPQTSDGARIVAARKLGLTVEEYSFRIASGLKRCTKCKEWISASLFNIDNSRWDKLTAKCQTCSRVKERISTKGRQSAFKGKKHTAEAKTAISCKKKGCLGPNKGEKRPASVGAKISETRRLNRDIHRARRLERQGVKVDIGSRGSAEYQEWRMSVFTRDKFTCQQCGDCKGGNLQAHHKLSYAKYIWLRLDVNNGITLCRDCHERIHLKPIPSLSDLKRRRVHK